MSPSWVIRLTIVLITVWAALTLVSPDGLGATPMHSIYVATGSNRWLLVFLMFSAASAAFVGEQLKPSLGSLALLLPLQTGILIVAFGAIWAMFDGHYADGVQRPWAFIAVDQVAYPCIAYFYTRDVLHRHGVRLRGLI